MASQTAPQALSLVYPSSSHCYPALPRPMDYSTVLFEQIANAISDPCAQLFI